MKKLFYTLAILSSFFALVSAMPTQVQAEGCKKGTVCQAWQSGVGSLPGGPTNCLVAVSAPTFGGEIGLDIRDADGKSLWLTPRIKMQRGPGIVTFYIGCWQLRPEVDQIYLCADGSKGKDGVAWGDGHPYSSRRLRSTGLLDQALKTHRLDLCLKGKECADYAGETPRREQKD